MKFLVTGGLGFIGHNVVRTLESQGHKCQIFDNQTTYNFIPQAELSYLLSHRIKGLRSEIRNIDITHYEALRLPYELYNPDVVIHLASYPRQKVVNQNPQLGSQVMITGLINLLELAKKNKTQKFVYISSSLVYGDFNNNADETTVCNPRGLYGILKLTGEQLVRDYAAQGAFDYTIVRPSAVYGECDVEDRVISKFIISALRNETIEVRGAGEVLDFTHVEDAAQGIALAAASNMSSNKIYNITRSDPQACTLLEAAAKIKSITGHGEIVVKDRDTSFPHRGRLDISLAKKELGFDPKINVDEGFRRYYHWYLQNSILWSR